ncbi:MAG TPA: hypothetical protein EYH11_05115 [Sulfurimonas autotrophica]|nr:hypothetical protein [Sulfurimonas autotrophica]
MSLKENIEMVKEELNSEEKFFEKAVITERFVKKYKNIMIGAVVAVTLFVIGDVVYSINKQQRLEAANKVLLQLEANPNDKATLTTLASLSPTLHDVWIYSQAVVAKDVKTLETLQNSKALLIGDLSSYEAAQHLQDFNKLQNYSQKQNAIYRDLAQVQMALLLMNENRLDEARSQLSMISINSPLAQLSRALMHYGVK